MNKQYKSKYTRTIRYKDGFGRWSYNTYFTVGCQGFEVCRGVDRKTAEWFRKMIAAALVNFIKEETS
jgi:hypothetical protein